MCFRNREFVRCELVRDVHSTRCCAFRGIRIDDLKVRAILADPQRHLVVKPNRIDRLRVDLPEVVDDVAQALVVRAAKVEAVEPADPVFLAAGDAVEVVLHAGREVILHELGEVVLEQPDDRERDPVRNERGAARRDVSAVDDRRNDRRERRRPPDTKLFERLDEACLRVARRRRSLVAFRFNVDEFERLARCQLGQFRLSGFCGLVAFFVVALFVRRQKATEGDDRSARNEISRVGIRLRRDRDRRRRSPGIRHL